MGLSVLFGPLLVKERVRKEKDSVILLRNFSFSSHPSYRLAGLLKNDWSGAVSCQGTASQDQQHGIKLCLKSYCVQVFLQVSENTFSQWLDFKLPPQKVCRKKPKLYQEKLKYLSMSLASGISMIISLVNMLSWLIFCSTLNREREKVSQLASFISLFEDKGFVGNYIKTYILY